LLSVAKCRGFVNLGSSGDRTRTSSKSTHSAQERLNKTQAYKIPESQPSTIPLIH
jgi:hypothetical protein